jgi:anti-anti-sigma factor
MTAPPSPRRNTPSRPPLACASSAGSGWRTLRVSGDLDNDGAARLLAALVSVWSKDTPHLLIDLTPTTFVGVAGLDVLAMARKTAQRHGTTLIVRTGSRHVARLMAIIGLADVTVLSPPPSLPRGSTTRNSQPAYRGAVRLVRCRNAVQG